MEVFSAKLRRLGGMALAALLSILAAGPAAAVPVDLPYPQDRDGLTGRQIIEQVYFVNHFYAFRNFAIVRKRRKITVLVSRAKGKRPTTNTLERYLNNDYRDDPVIKSKDLAIFRSGKLRGTGILITDYKDENKNQSYVIWLPALRKVRRFAQPAQDDAWGGLDFTFGDVVLRKPKDETHELLGKEIFRGCLQAMEIPKRHRNRYTRHVPEASCRPKGREVFKVKSTTKFKNWWYDYRISYIDTETFADYRTEYFKNGRKIKVIDRDWRRIEAIDDPRALAWGYWYGKNFITGHESWAVIPPEVIKYNANFKPSLWSERTLRKIKR